ncbi:MAG: SgcJ/EcaC family oxidoreductase [Pirellulales bacterium]|nr:SgcJ/EcaC family oxidoreductase [Pirellulales bacterium]
MRQTSVFALLIVMSGACLGLAKDPKPSSPAKKPPTEIRKSARELDAIRAGSRAFVTAFNKRNAKAIAELWTKDGEYIDETGRSFVGRDAIKKAYAQFFAENSKSKIQIMIDSLRLLSDDAAIENGRAVLEPAPAGAPGISKYTAIHVKVDGKWLMASVRDTWIEIPSAHQHIADLEWLIGTWVAEEHGAKYESVCRWVANKSFVERKYTLTHVDGTKTAGVQIIGWNPQAGHVQSWNFSPDGGYAVGVWSPRQDGWTAEMRGIAGDGKPTTSVNSLIKLDDNAYVWRSVKRMAGNVALSDTDEVVLKRQTASR